VEVAKNPWTEDTGHLAIRKAVFKDTRYITSSWLNSHYASPSNKGIRKSEYFRNEHKMLEVILPRATTLVLCNGTNLDQILGWVCYEKLAGNILLLHYVNMKQPYRKRGLARYLMEEVLELEAPSQVLYSYWTEQGGHIIRKHREELGSWRHNPYLKTALAPQDWLK
jgi:hypothetical protein